MRKLGRERERGKARESERERERVRTLENKEASLKWNRNFLQKLAKSI